MRILIRIGGALLALAVLVLGGTMAASELGGEVATLHTQDGAKDSATRVWVVDDAGHAWLRSGVPDSGWIVRIEANPDVILERGGRSTRFRAVPVRDPATRDRIHALMREHYGIADRIVSLMRDANGSVPIRLDPVEPAS